MELGLVIRAAEERLLALYSEGRISGTIHTCVGQELSGAAVGLHLAEGDYVFSNHRCHGHFLARTQNIKGLLAEVMGLQTGVSAGIGGSQHLTEDRFFSNGIIGGMIPIAAGAAYAGRLAEESRVTVAFIGDGSMAQGTVFEAMNLAAVFQAPLYIVAEINGIAQSTNVATVQAGDLERRAATFGIETISSDIWDVEALLADTSRAIDIVRREQRPVFHAIHCFRLNPHSKGDDLREPALIEAHRDRDPLNLFVRTHEQGAKLAAESKARVEAALDQIHNSTPATAAPAWHPPEGGTLAWVPARLSGERTINGIRDGLKQALQENSRTLILGEDVEAPNGGAFKATEGLSDDFPGRVRNMPISEAGIIGFSTGLALAGYRPVTEIMFGDFLTLTLDQLLNHASKFVLMYGRKVSLPLIIRSPMGARRGYGPTHSQSIEKHFLGIPGLTVLAPHHRMDTRALYASLAENVREPHLIIENKSLYPLRGSDGLLDGFIYLHRDGPYPTLRITPAVAPRVTLVGYGGMLPICEQAAAELFDEHEIAAEIICPLALYPADMEPILQSVRATGNLIIAEEGQTFAGFGAEAATRLREAGIPFRLRRVGPPATVIPAAIGAETAMLPQSNAITNAALELLS